MDIMREFAVRDEAGQERHRTGCVLEACGLLRRYGVGAEVVRAHDGVRLAYNERATWMPRAPWPMVGAA